LNIQLCCWAIAAKYKSSMLIDAKVAVSAEIWNWYFILNS
jgi:hypothetical protein